MFTPSKSLWKKKICYFSTEIVSIEGENCVSVCLWRCESVDGNASVAGNESGPSNQRTASRSRERDESRSGDVDVVVVDNDSDSDDDARRSWDRSLPPRRQGESFHLASWPRKKSFSSLRWTRRFLPSHAQRSTRNLTQLLLSRNSIVFEIADLRSNSFITFSSTTGSKLYLY